MREGDKSPLERRTKQIRTKYYVEEVRGGGGLDVLHSSQQYNRKFHTDDFVGGVAGEGESGGL